MAYKHGAMSGWKEYRYGSKDRNPVTLPQIFRGKERDNIVSRVMNELDDWRASPFEHEGAIVAGFRSALCLKGFSFAQSDHEAREIVKEGLRRNGAVRPNWEQGQREYATPEENCRWCGGEIQNDHMSTRTSYRYCSAVCAKSALQHREYETAWYRDNKALAAYRILLRDKTDARTCKECGSIFKPVRNAAETEFCSLKCSGKHRRVRHERPCQQCGKTFRPIGPTRRGQFCSVACHQAHVDHRKIESHCDYCGEMFYAKQPHAHFCCSKHSIQHHKITRKIRDMQLTGRVYKPRGPEAHLAQRMVDAAMAKSNVVYLTPEIFDGWFKRAA